MIKGDRIAALLQEQNISQSELARRVNVTQGTIAQLIRGRSRGSQHLHVIARELNTTPAFLNGETEDPSEGALPLPTATSVADQLDAVMLPEVQVSFSMGGGNVIDEWPVVQMVPFSRSWLRGLTNSPASELVVARGEGDSMMPTILDQDIVIIDRAQRTIKQQDRIWALSYGDVGMIKRVRALPGGSYQINSDNPAVTPISASEEEMFTIGRVVGVLRRI